MQTFGIDIVGQMFNDKENCILLTTSQLEKQFIWLLLNHPLLKPLTIFQNTRVPIRNQKLKRNYNWQKKYHSSNKK